MATPKYEESFCAFVKNNQRPKLYMYVHIRRYLHSYVPTTVKFETRRDMIVIPASANALLFLYPPSAQI